MDGRRIGIVALAALVVIDLVLIALALRPAPVPDPVVMPVEVGTEQPAGDVAPTPSATGSEAESFAPPAPERLVAVRSDGTALAVQTGACDAANSSGLEVDANGNARSVVVPGAVMGRLTTAAGGNLELVAAASDCSGQQSFTEADQPDEWTPQGPPNGIAYMFAGGTGITLSAATVPYPCEVKSFAPGGEAPAVLCADGSVLTAEGGAWTTQGTLGSGLAISGVSGAGGLVGLATADDCPGLTVHTSDDSGATWNRISCLNGVASGPGPVGIGAQGTTVVVVDGNGNPYRSTDSGGIFS
ncbi:MAG: hypothetical protein KDC23_10950 [Actinobacteria bacterium]|nr:hypothetical protein [Actinomycetota bacterium]